MVGDQACCGRSHRDGGQAGQQIDFQHPAIDQYKNDNAQRPHGHTDNRGLEPQAEKRPQVHALQGGFQLRHHIRRDVRGALDEPARLGDHGLRHIEHRHNDIKGVGQDENGTSRFEHPFIDIRHIKLVHIVLFQKHLYQLIGGNKGQHQTGNRQDHRFGKLAYKGENPGVPSRRGSPHLYRNLPDLGVDVIGEPLQVAHDPANQQLFEPVCEPVGEKIHKPLP